MSRSVRGVVGSRGRPLLVFAGVLAAMAAVVAGLSTTASASKGTAGHAPPYRLVLSNNFLGNDWRPQVERLATLTAKTPAFKNLVNLKIVNSQNTNQAQLADLNNIIQTKPDAILLIPGSSTALDASITRACNAGILVFTLSAPVGSACAINLNQDFGAGNFAMGEWMAKAMHGQGSVFIDHGIAGLSISQQIEQGFRQGLKKYGPNITVAGTYNGQYAAGPEQQGITSLLTANSDVGGIMTQGYCTPAFNALKAAGKPSVPTVCYGYNGEMTACASAGHQCAILTNTPAQVQLAMQMAVNILQGKQKKPHGGPAQKDWVGYPMDLYVTATPKVTLSAGHVTQVQVLKKNVNYFPNLPVGLSLPYTLPAFQKYITPQAAAGK
jgi:ribose transport system substrate-binding protein